MTNFLCFVIALHVVSFANLYVIKNLNLKNWQPDARYFTVKSTDFFYSVHMRLFVAYRNNFRYWDR